MGGPSIYVGFRRLQFTALVLRILYSATGDRGPAPQPVHGEKYLRRLLWYLLGGTRGGPNRVEIIKTLHERPMNANQLASAVKLDYKTVEHHLRVLRENGVVMSSEKEAYGAVLFLTSTVEEAWPIVEEIWGRIGRTKINSAENRGGKKTN